MSETKPKVILRLGTHAEKDYVEKLGPLLDGLILGANLLEATPGATASLILSVCGAKHDKCYFIDPMTYAFGVLSNPDSGQPWTDLDWLRSEQLVGKKGNKKPIRDFKRSYKGLGEAFGGVIAGALADKKAIDTEMLRKPGVAKALAQSTIDYQLTRVKKEFESDEEFKAYAAEVPHPGAVLAPYFYCEPSNWGPWLDVNLSLAKESAALSRDVPTHAVVCADADTLLVPAFVKRVIEEVPEQGVNGVWLWFSKLYEEDAKLPALQSLRSVVEGLNKAGLEVYNMHGGYFSLALSKYGLHGVSHGVGYGEQKDVVPVIGQSVPTVRYYLPAVHRKLGVPDIERCFDDLGIKTPADFHERVCDCPVCKGVVTTDLAQFRAFGETQPSSTSGLRLVQTPAAAKRCRFHYLVTRIRERDRLPNLSIPAIREAWTNAEAMWGKYPQLRESLKHLERWKVAFT